MIDIFAQMVKARIRKDMNDLCDSMAAGKCKSYEAYQYSCGIIRGLALAEQYLADARDELEKKDDE